MIKALWLAIKAGNKSFWITLKLELANLKLKNTEKVLEKSKKQGDTV